MFEETLALRSKNQWDGKQGKRHGLLFAWTYYNLNERTVVMEFERSTNGMLAKRVQIAREQTLEPITSSADGHEVNLVSIAIDLLNHKCLTLVNCLLDLEVDDSSHWFRSLLLPRDIDPSQRQFAV